MSEANVSLGRLVTELQVHGVVDPAVAGNKGRRGGAGPSDHRALTIDGTTVMVWVDNSGTSIPLPASIRAACE